MTDTALPIAAPAPTESPFRRIVSEFAESKLAVFGMVVLAIFLAAALLAPWLAPQNPYGRSEEHTSELQTLMRISYAVFCLKQKHLVHTITYRDINTIT